jgi:hypothetical protein
MSAVEQEEHDELSAALGLALPPADARGRLVSALANVMKQVGATVNIAAEP